MVHHNSDSSFVVEVKSKQHLDALLMELKNQYLVSSMNHSPNGGGMVYLGTKGDYVQQMLRI